MLRNVIDLARAQDWEWGGEDDEEVGSAERRYMDELQIAFKSRTQGIHYFDAS